MKRVLLDENLPRLLRRSLSGLDCTTVADAGWAGIKNGELLRRAAEEFAVFLTADRNLEHQQSLSGSRLGVVVIVLGSTKLRDLEAHAADILAAVQVVEPGQVLRVGRTR